MVLGQALAADVQLAEVVLRGHVALVRGHAIPAHRLGIALRYALADVVHQADVGLRHGISGDSQWHELAKCGVVVASV